MEIVRCSKGHFYDSEENSTCPMCAAENSVSIQGVENILATDAFAFKGSTQAVPSPTVFVGKPEGKVQRYAPTVGVGFNGSGRVESYMATMPISPVVASRDAGSAAEVFNPVVGWLVCVEGPSRGKDYRIRNQYNYIGRSSRMDISIPEDAYISNENSAIIAFDDVERAFFFGPGSGHNAVRVNGQMILTTTMIQPYDMLTVGKTKLIFVPLCGDRFDWNETK